LLVRKFFKLVSRNIGCPSPITDTERRKEESFIDSLAGKLIVGLETPEEEIIVEIVSKYMDVMFEKAPYIFSGSIIALMTNRWIIPYRSRLLANEQSAKQTEEELTNHLAVQDKIRRKSNENH